MAGWRGKRQLREQLTSVLAHGQLDRTRGFLRYTRTPSPASRERTSRQCWIYSHFIVTEKPGREKSTCSEWMVVSFPEGQACARLAAQQVQNIPFPVLLRTAQLALSDEGPHEHKQ